MPAQCTFIHPDGRRCGSWCIGDSDFCWFHSRKSKPPEPENIIDAMQDPEAFGPAFPEGLESWASWAVALEALYGLPMDEDELSLFQHFTGREKCDPNGYTEAYFVVGPRGGKSRIAATIAAWEAVFGNWSKRLSAGERAWIFIIATDKAQAGVVMGYLRELISFFPDLIERESIEELHLKNGVSITVKTCSYRGTRGFSTAMVILDELAFWRDENSANPASEVVISLLPRLMPGAKMIGISTGYGKFGLLYDMYDTYFAKGGKGSPLVWSGPTVEMNPTYSEEIINRLIARDPAVFGPEYAGLFREDVSNFLSEVVLRSAMTNQTSMPKSGVRYSAFVDPSGGRSDSFTLGISHREGEKIVLDRVEERRPPFDPSRIVEEFVQIAKSYGIYSITGDRYGGEWVVEAFRKAGMRLDPSDLPASDLYLEFAALLNSNRVILVDDETLARQFLALERRARSGGKDLVDHPQGMHDDLANSAAGAIVLSARGVTWDEREMAAHLPQKTRMSPLGRAQEEHQSLEDECKPEGGSRIVRW